MYCSSVFMNPYFWFLTLAVQNMQSGATVPEANNGALVVYDETILLPHHKPHQSFQFGLNNISIKQTWAVDGVAGVVWDAVSIVTQFVSVNNSGL